MEKRIQNSGVESKKERQLPNGNLELSYFSNRYETLLGIDEVGRGCLAGPVVSCGILAERVDVLYLKSLGVQDSKKITSRKREEIAEKIKNSGVEFFTSIIGNQKIDETNILQSTLLSFQEVCENFKHRNPFVLVDGNQFIKNSGLEFQTIIKGDQKSVIVAAASIIAKVTRDKLMSEEYHYQYPAYNFEKHKGYGTKEHISSILTNGYSPLHRLSFLKKINTKIEKENTLFD